MPREQLTDSSGWQPAAYLSEPALEFLVSFLFSLLPLSGANSVCFPGFVNCRERRALAVLPWTEEGDQRVSLTPDRRTSLSTGPEHLHSGGCVEKSTLLVYMPPLLLTIYTAFVIWVSWTTDARDWHTEDSNGCHHMETTAKDTAHPTAQNQGSK